MIQRIQSVWLLVAGLLALATFKIAFFTATINGKVIPYHTDNSDSLLIYIALILLILVSFGTIFLFKQRPLQSRLCLLGIVLCVGLVALEDHQVDVIKALPFYSAGSWSLGIALPIVIVVPFILAMRGIRKDQKLVRSLDRLR